MVTTSLWECAPLDLNIFRLDYFSYCKNLACVLLTSEGSSAWFPWEEFLLAEPVFKVQSNSSQVRALNSSHSVTLSMRRENICRYTCTHTAERQNGAADMIRSKTRAQRMEKPDSQFPPSTSAKGTNRARWWATPKVDVWCDCVRGLHCLPVRWLLLLWVSGDFLSLLFAQQVSPRRRNWREVCVLAARCLVGQSAIGGAWSVAGRLGEKVQWCNNASSTVWLKKRFLGAF